MAERFDSLDRDGAASQGLKPWSSSTLQPIGGGKGGRSGAGVSKLVFSEFKREMRSLKEQPGNRQGHACYLFVSSNLSFGGVQIHRLGSANKNAPWFEICSSSWQRSRDHLAPFLLPEEENLFHSGFRKGQTTSIAWESTESAGERRRVSTAPKVPKRPGC